MKTDLMGRWMPECNTTFSVFSREKYWSTLYAKAQENPWRAPHHNKIHDRMLIPQMGYSAGGFGDGAESHSAYTYPIEELVRYLALKSTMNNSVMVNQENEIIAFDSGERVGEDLGLCFDLDELMHYANHKDLVPLWTVLALQCMKDNWALTFQAFAILTMKGIFEAYIGQYIISALLPPSGNGHICVYTFFTPFMHSSG